ncbi:hypothetical protein ARMGADRAFT_1026148 [Armillaria gallica]|uniref:Uncharacterized protein n=1 Tax=Armillaria gallica TaxID=47427 RepID=A0A2H3EIV1_ARMGA|nr:hypothetical protein ARMGADRAFT_1026148 [Armillaria gallica]
MGDYVPLVLQLGVDSHYSFYAEKTLLLWEYLITFYDEIKYLFFVNRYLNIALRIWDVIVIGYKIYQVIVMESILILRVWAIVGRKPNVLVSFSILLFLNVAATLGIYFAMPTTSLTFCYRVLCCIPILAFVNNEKNNEIGLSFMSITITRMLLRLRKRAKADLNMPRSQDMELESFRAANSFEGVSIASDA